MHGDGSKAFSFCHDTSISRYVVVMTQKVTCFRVFINAPRRLYDWGMASPIDVLIKILEFASSVVQGTGAKRGDRSERPTVPGLRPIKARRAPVAVVRRSPSAVGAAAKHMWCVTANGRGRGRSVEHCAYCDVPRDENNVDELCPVRG